jgi:Zn-dependent membrane protease YugP
MRGEIKKLKRTIVFLQVMMFIVILAAGIGWCYILRGIVIGEWWMVIIGVLIFMLNGFSIITYLNELPRLRELYNAAERLESAEEVPISDEFKASVDKFVKELDEAVEKEAKRLKDSHKDD